MERKMQAAALCVEVQAQEDIEMDLGKKGNVPKDIMLEELSLTSNRGSRLFKMRQRRSEKYTFESIRDENTKQPSGAVDCQTDNGNTTNNHSGEKDLAPDQPAEVPTEAPERRAAPNPDIIAPGYGVPLKDIPPEKFNNTAVPKSYQSPWDISNRPTLADSPATCRAPQPQPDQRGYKSFNRVAIPFGGFSKTARPAPVKYLQVEPLPDYPEIQGSTSPNQTSFNRSAQGWMSAGGPVPVPMVPLERVLIPESDDL